jgi:hypothetical protein
MSCRRSDRTTRKRREVMYRPSLCAEWLVGVYAAVEATNAPCQVWYQTAPVEALTESMPES